VDPMFKVTKHGSYAGGEKTTPIFDATHYNNFYEFSTDKEDVAERSKNLHTRPWTVSVEGHINKPKVYNIDEVIKMFYLGRAYLFGSVAWRDGQWSSLGSVFPLSDS